MGVDFGPSPLRATLHCRHYDYQPGGGPSCARGVDLAGQSVVKCLPGRAGGCPSREEYTASERAAWEEWRRHRIVRTLALVEAVPGSSRDKKGRECWGERGTFQCPNCEAGTVHWSRSSYNGHARAVCTTPHCSEFIE